MKASLALATLAILATNCRGEKSTFPSLAPSDTPSPTFTLVEDSPVSSQSSSSTDLPESLILSSAAHSKMSSALINLHQLSTATPEPTYAPTSLIPTMTPPSGELFSFVPAHSGDYGVNFSDTEVLCNSAVESTATYRSIEIPYFSQIKSHLDTSVGVLLQRMESSLIAALAENILTCANEESEDIRRLVGSDGAAQARVVAAYSLPQDIISNKYSCPSDSYMNHCHLVEGKITLIIEGGDESRDGAIVSKVYVVLRIAFLALGGQDNVQVSFIGNDPYSLSDKQAADDASENDVGVFFTVFLAISVCGSAIALVSAVAFRCARFHKKDEHVCYEKELFRVPSTIEITSPASSDDMDTRRGRSLHVRMDPFIFAEEDQYSLGQQLPSVKFSGSRLPQVPEEASFECDEMSV